MKRTIWRALIVVALVANFLTIAPAGANHPTPDIPSPVVPPVDSMRAQADEYAYPIDEPNPNDAAKLLQRERLLNAGQTAEAAALAKTGTDRALVILVEFAGTDVVTWTAPTNPLTPTTGSRWDPYGLADTNEAVWNAAGTNIVSGDCSKIITQTTVFTYTGPLHNQLPRPLSGPPERSGDSVWTPDFSAQWFKDFMFGNGVTFSYTRTDGSLVNENFIGKSVSNYYTDMSSGAYTLTGDVVGWLPVQHSEMWYGADVCPGARSNPPGTTRPAYNGGIPGAGNNTSLVRDALNAVNAISNTLIITDSQGVGRPFNWTDYDTNGDGVIDRLWIVHAGYGEEDSTILLNRIAPYGEGAMWSHSSSGTTVPLAPGIAARPYIMMPENGGISVFAHESAHNIGAPDLYDTSGYGNESGGMWTLMSDSWTGSPIGYEPQAFDPLNLDLWGWLNPAMITDTSKVYTVTLGQASAFPGGAGVDRGAKIQLPGKPYTLSAPLWSGSYYWWGGKQDLSNAMMTGKSPISLTGATTATLSFDLAYDTERNYDALWIQVSTDGGGAWSIITNTNTSTNTAVLGGFSGRNPGWPAPQVQTFDLTPFVGQNVWLRFWYFTDPNTLGNGPFVDNVRVATNANPSLFFDNAEVGDANWTYQAPWVRTNGLGYNAQYFYLQWRNVSKLGGYDETLADARYRYGPANTGLLMWYNDTSYSNNTIYSYMSQGMSWGAKGRMLVVDSHSDPYRDPYWAEYGYNNEGGNLPSRSMMRDATFSLNPTVNFTFTAANGAYTDTLFSGRPAVSTFHDALGYYPGAEYVSRGPAYPLTDTMRWVTRYWDGSVVVPASAPYPVKAPGYFGTGGTTNQEWRYGCTKITTGVNAGKLSCYYYGVNTGLGYNGGTGNPGDYGVQYGWHVQILSQAGDGATAMVKIWNATRDADQSFTPDKTTAQVGDTIKYTYDMAQNWGSPLNLYVCAPIDTSKATYVPGSATNGAVASTVPCPPAPSAPAAGVNAPEAAVASVVWTGNVATGGSANFSFQVTVTSPMGNIPASARVFDMTPGSTWKETVTGPEVATVPVADFTASATDVPVNTVITFTNNSTGTLPLFYVWDFGDSTAPITDTNPTHAFVAAGSYTVTLTVTNTAGSDSHQLAIKVGAPAAASFTPSAAGVSTQQIVTFTNTSTGTDPTYLWDFGDGATSTQTSPSHAYSLAGTYTVTLTASNAYGPPSSAQAVITVFAPDLWVLKSGPATAKVGDVVTYTVTYGNDGAGQAHNAWISDTVLLGTTPITQFAIWLGNVPPAPFSFTLHYTTTVLPFYAGVTVTNQVNIYTTDVDADPTDNAAATQTFVGVPAAAAFATSAMSVMVNTPITLTNLSIGTPPLTYQWNYGDGSPVDTTVNATHVYTRWGVFTATLTASNAWVPASTYQVVIAVTPYQTFLPIALR